MRVPAPFLRFSCQDQSGVDLQDDSWTALFEQTVQPYARQPRLLVSVGPARVLDGDGRPMIVVARASRGGSAPRFERLSTVSPARRVPCRRFTVCPSDNAENREDSLTSEPLARMK